MKLGSRDVRLKSRSGGKKEEMFLLVPPRVSKGLSDGRKYHIDVIELAILHTATAANKMWETKDGSSRRDPREEELAAEICMLAESLSSRYAMEQGVLHSDKSLLIEYERTK